MNYKMIALAKKFNKIANDPSEFKMRSLLNEPKDDEFSFTSLINPGSSGSFELSGDDMAPETVRSVNGPSSVGGHIIEMRSLLDELDRAQMAGDYDSAERILNDIAENNATIAAKIETKR